MAKSKEKNKENTEKNQVLIKKLNKNLEELNINLSRNVTLVKPNKIKDYVIALVFLFGIVIFVFGVVINNEWDLRIGTGLGIVAVGVALIIMS